MNEQLPSYLYHVLQAELKEKVNMEVYNYWIIMLDSDNAEVSYTSR